MGLGLHSVPSCLGDLGKPLPSEPHVPIWRGECCLCSAYLDPGEDTDCDQNHGEDGGCVPGPWGECRLCTRTVGWMLTLLCIRTMGRLQAVYQDRGEEAGCVPGPWGGCRLCTRTVGWMETLLCTRTVGRMQAVYQDRGVDVDSAVYQDRGEDAGCVSGPWGGCVTSPPSHGLGTEERKAAGLTASGQPGQSWVGLSSPWTSHFSFLDLSFIPVN